MRLKRYQQQLPNWDCRPQLAQERKNLFDRQIVIDTRFHFLNQFKQQ